MKTIEQYLQCKIKEFRAQEISILEAQAECYGYIDYIHEIGKINEDEKHIVRIYVTKKFLEV